MYLSEKLTDFIATKLEMDDERKAVVRYGMIAIVQMMELLLASIIFGWAFHCFYETMIVFWGVGLMRRSTGGAHCENYLACLLTSSLTICLVAFVCRYATPGWVEPKLFLLFPFLPCLLLFTLVAYKRVPVASTHKPITRPEKIRRLRQRTWITLALYIGFGLVLLFVPSNDKRNISSFCALCAVLLWQGCMMLPFSESITGYMDRLFICKDK